MFLDTSLLLKQSATLYNNRHYKAKKIDKFNDLNTLKSLIESYTCNSFLYPFQQ